MAGVISGKSWRDFLQKHTQIPPAFDRQHSAPEIGTPLCISLKSVEAVISKENGAEPEFQLYVSLYDMAYKQYFGRQWMGPIKPSKTSSGNTTRLPYDQNVYFHTSLNNANVVAIVEVISVTTDTNGKTKKASCGWGVLRIFKYQGDMPDSSRNIQLPTQKIDMYHGSPKALYFMEDPIESNTYLKPITGCHLTYTICTHKALLKVMNLLPENVIVGNNDIIPGIVDTQKPGVDRLKRPKLLKSVPCQLNNVSLMLPPSVDKFEEELCQLLQEDRLNRDNRNADGSQVSIIERRLQIGVHNGWCYVERPQTVHLVTDTPSSSVKPTASPSQRRTSLFAHQRTPSGGSVNSVNAQCLVLKNRIQLNELLEDPMFAIVFTLEYIVGEPMSAEDRRMSTSMMRAQTRTIAVRWAVWNPFLSHGQSEISLALIGGPCPVPDDTFVYKKPRTHMQEESVAKTAAGTMTFQWIDGRKGQMANGFPMAALPPYVVDGSMNSARSSEGSEGVLLDSSGHYAKPPVPNQKARSYASVGSMQGGLIPQQPGEMMPSQMSMMPSSMGMMPSSMGMMPHTGAIVPPGGIMHPQMAQMMYGQNQVFGVPMSHGYGPLPQASTGYAMEVTHVTEPGAPDLAELPFTPTHAPIMVGQPHTISGHCLSRAAYARLYAVGFPQIVDRNNEPPEVIDPQSHVMINLAKEEADPLQVNEVIFQFLAYSKMLSFEATGPAQTAGAVFFTFQFYRFPQVTTERMLLSKPQTDLSSDPKSMPFILQRLDKDGSIMKGPPGAEVRYYVDPNYLKPGEHRLFLQHLSQQTLHIDVWDGDSLMLIGSCAIDLKYLCRSGHEAVQTTFELDVVTTEYQDESTSMTGDINRGGSVRPVGVTSIIRGHLHLRLANVGHTVDTKTLKPATGMVNASNVSKLNQIISQTAGNSAYAGGSLTTGYRDPKMLTKKTVRANHMAENNREVAELLISQRDKLTSLEDSNREGSAEKIRKIARMQAVRRLEGDENQPITIMGMKQDKLDRARDLKTMKIYSQQTKRDNIVNMLNQDITTQHVLHPGFGVVEFFEFVLKNPYNVKQTIVVECNDPELSVVTDAREWLHYKQRNNIQSPIEEGMFSKQGSSQYSELFLRPKETVNIPFKFQTFQADHSVNPQGPVDPFRRIDGVNAKKTVDKQQTRTVRVFFKTEDHRAIAILALRVEPQPQVIDQTFRFHHPEQSFLKKAIRLPPFNAIPGASVGGVSTNKVYVRSSDINVICESKPTQDGEPQDVFVKVACGASPQVKKFFVAIYTDHYLSRPIQVWQFYVHALQRVDVDCVEGQSSRFSLILRGTQSSRLVRCFSSHPQEMQLQPNTPFMLAASTVHELNVAVRSMRVGNKFFYINVVDTEYHQLLRTWMVCVNCRAPMVSRAFELALPVGGGKGSNKRITYTNPYPHRRVFLLRCNRDDLLQFKETRIEVDGGSSHVIGFCFAPASMPGTAEILVFINDEEDKNEETFCIKATYAHR